MPSLITLSPMKVIALIGLRFFVPEKKQKRGITVDKIKLTLPTKIEYVGLARLTIASVADGMGFNIDEVEDLKVAISEACANVVMHSQTSETTYDLIYSIGEKELTISVIDTGVGFDPEKVAKGELNTLQIGSGFGIIIMKILTDEVTIDSKKGAGSVVTMKKILRGNDEI